MLRAAGLDSRAVLAAECHHRSAGRPPVLRALGRTDLTAALGAGSRPTAVGDAGCREGPIRPPRPAGTGLRIRSAHRVVRTARRGSDLARRGPLVPGAIRPTLCGCSCDPRHSSEGDSCYFSGALNAIPLTTVDGEETIPEVPLEFLPFRRRTMPRWTQPRSSARLVRPGGPTSSRRGSPSPARRLAAGPGDDDDAMSGATGSGPQNLRRTAANQQ